MRPFRLTDLAAEAVAQLKEEGIQPTAQQILDIQRLSLEAGGEELSRGRPCECGGTTFWPLTIGAAAWLSDNAAYFAEGGDAAQLLAFAYASAHAREKGAFNEYGSAAVRVVRAWRRGLLCTEDELFDAMERITRDALVIPKEDEAEVLGVTLEPEDLAISLAALCGGDYSAWLWFVSLNAARRIVEIKVAQIQEEHGRTPPPKGLEGARRLSRYCAALKARKEDSRNASEG